MDAVIPVFLHANDPFAGEFPKFESVMDAARKATEVRQVQRVHIASDDAGVLSAAKNFSFNPIFIRRRECDPALPPFTKNILEELHVSGFNGEFMFVNFRNPLLTTGLLQEAVERFSSSPKDILLSAVQPKDHPCQARLAYDLPMIGRLMSFSDCCKPGEYRTVAFKGPSKLINGEMEAEGISTLTHLQDGYFYFKVSDSSFNDAKLLSAKCKFDLPLAGLSFDQNFLQSGFLFKTPEGNCRLAFNATEKLDEYCELILTTDDSIQFWVPNAQRSNGVVWFDFEPFSTAENINCNYRLVRPSEPPIEFDLNVSPLIEGAPWECELLTNRAVNLETMREISGRQDFPGIFEPDTSFCITGLLKFLENGLENADFEPYILETEESLTINSAFDVLRLNALKRATNLGDLSKKAA